MTPVYLNPPPSPFAFVELKEERLLQFFPSVPQQTASSLSVDDHHPTFFNTANPEVSNHDHKVNKCDCGSSDHQRASSSSSFQSAMDHSVANGPRNLSFARKEDGDYESAGDHNNGSSVKWMSSKMRLMKKMMNSNCSTGSANHNKAVEFTQKFQYPTHDSDETNSFRKISNSTIRVCSDCNTTTTPLWRSGPRGPKSLCNACGIRQRKARRAMEAAAAAAAANGAAVATDATISMKIKVHNNKEKKSRTTSHVGQYKKHHHQFKAAATSSDHNSHYQQNQKKLCFKEFALSLSKSSALQRVFPRDVEDAAILLMELSCGLVHS